MSKDEFQVGPSARYLHELLALLLDPLNMPVKVRPL